MLAPCGLVCTDCCVYKAAQDQKKAEELAVQWQQQGCPDAKPEWFKCRGCKGEDKYVWGDDCEIRNCCLKTKKLDNCSLCDSFPCEYILNFENDGLEHHKAAITNLRRMRGD